MEPGVVMSFLIGAGLFIVLAVLYTRARKQQLLHQERMAALERGVPVPAPEPEQPFTARVYLLRGLIWSFCGTAIVVCLLGLAAARHRPQSAYDMAFEAKRLSDTAGISREDAQRIVEKDAASQVNGMPASVALLGLIPLSIGLAYLVFYYTGESRKPAGGEGGRDGERA